MLIIINSGILIISIISLILLIRKIYSTATIPENEIKTKNQYRLIKNSEIKEYLLTSV